jgi:chemotaxis protein MotB
MKINRQLIRKIQAKYPHEDVDSEGSWAVSYGDMITLLLTFFIIFFSIHPTNSSDTKTPVKDDGLQVALIKALKAERVGDVFSSNEVGQNAATNTIKLAEDNSNEDGASKNILQDLKGKVHKKGQQILIEFPEISFFDSAKIRLRPDGELALQDFAKVFLPYMGHFNVGIRAFTDSRKVIADSAVRFKDNLELSALRGVAAMRVLQKSGLPLERIKVGGYGEMRTTMRDLASLTEAETQEEKIKSLSLSRKIVLVIEPVDVQSQIQGGPSADEN